VCKLVLRFREAFWETKLEGPERIDFLHDPNGAFPTWWLARPWQAPMLTAWAGGPAADALAPLDEPALVARALASLTEMLGEPARKVERLLEAWCVHDWRRDVWSRGAYSYAGVGGSDAAARLRRPVAGTLFFAGEALSDDESGTVSGALATGEDAAKRLRRALNA
jgi:monoamine oxidase